MNSYREEIARRYGFRSFAELLDISDPLPIGEGNTVPTYVARHPKGHWFVWEDLAPGDRVNLSNGSQEARQD